MNIYIYIYIYIHMFPSWSTRKQTDSQQVADRERVADPYWRDAVRGARCGLEYVDLLRDILVSELTSRWHFKGKRSDLLWLRSPKITEIYVCLLGGLAPFHGSELLGCGQMGSTLMGPLQNNEFWQIERKGTPWHFWEDDSRLMGVPKKSLCQKTWNLQRPH